LNNTDCATTCATPCNHTPLERQLAGAVIRNVTDNAQLQQENRDLRDVVITQTSGKVTAELDARLGQLLMSSKIRTGAATESALVAEIQKFAAAYVSGEALIADLKLEIGALRKANADRKGHVELLERQKGEILAGYDNVVAELELSQQKLAKVEKKVKKLKAKPAQQTAQA
jgi:hypothetical protein